MISRRSNSVVVVVVVGGGAWFCFGNVNTHVGCVWIRAGLIHTQPTCVLTWVRDQATVQRVSRETPSNRLWGLGFHLCCIEPMGRLVVPPPSPPGCSSVVPPPSPPGYLLLGVAVCFLLHLLPGVVVWFLHHLLGVVVWFLHRLLLGVVVWFLPPSPPGCSSVVPTPSPPWCVYGASQPARRRPPSFV